MIILNPGYSVTVTLGSLESLTVNARGSVLVEAVSGLGLIAGVIATISGARTFGPYSAGVIRLTASGGDCSYGVMPAVSYDAANVAITGGMIGGMPIPRTRLGALTAFHNNRTDQSTFTGYSWQTTFCLPEKAEMIRFAFPAACSAGAATVDSAIIVPTGDLNAGAIAATGAVVAVTFNGGDAGISQPLSAANGGNNKGIVWSDWIPVASLDRTDIIGGPPAYALRVYSASAFTAGAGNGVIEQAIASSTYPLPFATWYKVGDFLSTNYFGFTSPTAAGVSLMMACEYVAATGSRTRNLVEYGDSMSTGHQLTDQGIGPLAIAAKAMRTAGLRAAYASFSQPGRSVQNSFLCFAGATPKLPTGSIVIFRPYSRNSGANADSMRYARAFLELCATYGLVPVLQTGIYESATPANNTTMQSINASVRTLASLTGTTLMELETVFTSANAATLLQGDGIHPTTAGRAALATVYQTTLSAMS